MNKLMTIKNNELEISFNNTRLTDKKEPIEHYHDAYEIAFFLEADIQLFIKDKKYLITNGDLIFIKEYELHKIVYSGMKNYSRYVINFKKDYLLKLLQVLDTNCLLPEKHIKASTSFNQGEEVEKLIQEIKETHDSNLENSLKQALIKARLILLLNKLKDLIKKSPPLIKSKKEEHVQRIIYFIDQNYMNNINLDVLANKLYLNKYYISHIFKEITGFSLIEYLQHKRIIIAQKMLSKPEEEITNIAYDCGFNNLQHFYRVFKKITKTTPAEFQKNKNK